MEDKQPKKIDWEHAANPSKLLAPLGLELPTADNIPRSSTDTLRSLDISLNIPRIILPMDTEDSPWGGWYLLFCQIENVDI